MTRSIRLLVTTTFAAASLIAGAATLSAQQAAPPDLVPGPSTNMVGGPVKFKIEPGQPATIAEGDPFLQRQNEPSCAVMTRNPLRVFCGANDYRTVDLPGLPEDKLTGDAWLGVFWSVDGGEKWRNALLPGFPQDRSPAGIASPIHGFEAGADPTLRAGAGDMIYYSGIAFNRSATNSSASGADGKNGVLFVARYNHPNLPNDPDPFKYLNTVVVDSGSQGRFLDKPWLAVDSPRAGAGSCTVSIPGATTQSIPAGNAYLAYAVFVGNDVNIRTKILFSRSTNCGASWSNPTKLSEGYPVNQGVSIGIDPRTGWVYVVWRQMAANNTVDGMLYVVSKDGGVTFTKAAPIALPPPITLADGSTLTAFFDQKATGVSVRTVAFPTIAVGDSGIDGVPGPVYVVWSQRIVQQQDGGTIRDARVVATVGTPTSTGLQFSAPLPVNNGPGVRGHQFQPSAAVIAGRLDVAYLNLIEDHTSGLFTPIHICLPGATTTADCSLAYQEDRYATGDRASGDLWKILNDFLIDLAKDPATQDYTIPLKRRHTLDTWLSKAELSSGGSLQWTSLRVSDYRFADKGKRADSGLVLYDQVQYSPPNLKLFSQGTLAFVGDYIDFGAQLFRPEGGKFVHNTSRPATGAPPFYVTWTDNRDVRAPADGDWTKYTPPFYPELGGQSIYAPGQQQPACDPAKYTRVGMRNQNVYASRITEGVFVSSITNQKPLSRTEVQSGDTTVTVAEHVFPVTVSNETDQTRTFRVVLTPDPTAPDPTAPDPTAASFDQFNPNVKQLDLKILRRSSVSRNVFVHSSNRKAQVRVDVWEINSLESPDPTANGLRSSTLLNPDPTAPDPTAPDPTAPDPTAIETYDVDLSAPDPTAAAVDVSSSLKAPDPTAPDPTADSIKVPDPTAPDPTAPDPTAPDPTAPDPTAKDLASPDATAPDPTAPDPTAPDPTAPDPTATALTDTVYKITNSGDSAASYKVNLYLAKPLPQGYRLQLILNKFYATPAAVGCQPTTRENAVVVSNIPDPTTISMPDPTAPDPTAPDPTATGLSDSTIALAPGETAYITVRLFDPVRADNISYTDASGRRHTYDPQFNPVTDTIPSVLPPVPNDQHAIDPGLPPAPVFPLTITPGVLPDGVVGTAYGAELNVIGGTGPFTWTATSLPPGLTFLDGAITGTPTGAGTSTFTAHVIDSSTPPREATSPIEIRIATPLIIETTSPLPDAVRGAAYTTMLAASGGFAPLSWSVTSGSLPPGLVMATDGTIGGTATTSGVYMFSATVTASGSPAQRATAAFEIRVADPLRITTVTLPDGGVGIPYSQAIQATGGTGTLTWRHAAGTLPPGLSLGTDGVISGTPETFGLTAFLVDVTDSGTPAQMDSATFTVSIAVGPQTYHVTTNADSGPGSLRQAVIYANANAPAPDTIVFDGIVYPTVMTIALNSPLPAITDSILFDTLCGMFNPCIELDGTNAGPGAVGLNVQADHTTIRGFNIHNFSSDGLRVGGSLMNVVAANFIGTDITGTSARPNGGFGIVVMGSNATIGGGYRNLVSGNGAGGILILGTGASITNAYVGTNAAGGAAIGNVGNGIEVAGLGATIGTGNVISGNTNSGIIFALSAGGNVVTGSRIGTTAAGTAALPNRTGITLLGSGNTIGGTAAGSGNLISGNTGQGIAISGGDADTNVVQGNLIGTDADGSFAVPNGTEGITIGAGASGNTIGGTLAAARNIISGNGNNGVNIINASGNFVTGNYIGTRINGTAAIPNSTGVLVNGNSANNTIGGSTPGAGNLISGNATYGIALTDTSTGTTVAGNRIGTNATGTSALGNTSNGILIDHASASIAGGEVVSGNLVSGNGDFVAGSGGVGIAIWNSTGTTPTVVSGNLVGTDVTGASALGNRSTGILLVSSSNVQIGGPTAAARNVVSANGIGVAANGITVTRSSNVTIQGNFVGTDVYGTAALPNSGGGIGLSYSSDNFVGGTAAGAGNLVSGNLRGGISLDNSDRNLIGNNTVGTDVSQTLPLGNEADGVNIGGSNNTIGGTARARNTIAWNGFSGVMIRDGSGNAIHENYIHGNGRIGIDLGTVTGVTPNDDAPDADTGPNDFQNYPVITSASTLAVSGTLTSTPNTTFAIELFANDSCDPTGYGQGQTWVFTAGRTTDASGNMFFTADFSGTTLVREGQYITATATSPNGSTSEFSQCFVIGPSTSPTGAGRTGPQWPLPGSTSNLLIVEVTPGTNPTSTGVTVVADVSALGGPSALALDDGGMYGPSGCDDVAGDGMYIACFNVSAGTAPGNYYLPVTISDAQGRTTSTTVGVHIAGTGGFTATLTDTSGGIIPGATLTVQGLYTGTRRAYVTAPDGTFSDPSIPEDNYTVYSGVTPLQPVFTVYPGITTTVGNVHP